MEVPGYHVKIENGLDAKKFIAKYFPGFSPTDVSEQADLLLAPMAITELERKWELSDPPPAISFFFGSKDAFNEQTGVCISRTFRHTHEGIIVSHDYFTIPKQYRQHGAGRQVLKVWLALYEAMKVARITVNAGLTDGGYVWARAGFKAIRKAQVDRILVAAKVQVTPAQFELVQSYYDDHYNNFPDQPFSLEYWSRMRFMQPVLKASSWVGQIDLTNESEMTNFKKYVNR